MKHIIISIIAGLTGIFVSLTLYMIFRADMVERTAAASIDASARTSRKQLDSVNKNAGDNEAMSRRLEELARKTDRLALLAAVEVNRTVLWTSKNQHYIPTSSLYDAIMNDFTAGKITAQREGNPLPRYYSPDGTQGGELKFYCYSHQVNGMSYLMAFAYDPARSVLIRFILEIILLVVLNASGAILIFLILRGNAGSPISMRPGSVSERIASSGGRGTDPEGALEDEIRYFFSTMAQDVMPDAARMYIIRDDGEACVEFEHRHGRAMTVQRDADASHGLDESALGELRGSAALVADEGRKVYAPVIGGGRIIALTVVEKKQGITGSDLNRITVALKSTAPAIGDYLAAQRLHMDADTGLFSKNFCDTKLEECRYRYDEFQEDGSIILVELNVEYTIEDTNVLIKAVVPMIRQWLPADHHLCRYDDRIAAILPGIPGLRARGLAEKVMQTLSETRVRVSETVLLPLRPRIGIASASTTGRGSFINCALADMDEPRY